MSIKNKLKNFIPDIPNKRYGIYCGTNDFKDFFILLKNFFKIILFSINKKEDLIKKFEIEFANRVNQKYCLTYGSGRMALYSILKTMNIKKKDEIIIPAFTCSVVPNAIIYSGATPIYVDINLKNFNLDINLLEKKITKKTIAVYVQHTFGVKCDMKKIFKIAKKYKLKIIEDNAHFLDLNTSKTSEVYASFFSLDHSKIMNTHLGGVASTNKINVYNKLKNSYKNMHTLKKFDDLRILFSFLIEILIFNPYILWIGRPIFNFLNYIKITFYFRDEMLIKKPYYYPCRYNNFLAEIGLKQIKNIKHNLKHRVKIASYLEKKIKWYKFNNKEISKNSWLRYSFLVKNRKKFVRFFKKKFNLDIWYTSLFEGRNKNYSEINYKTGSCPKAEYASKHIINFPTHLQIKKDIYEKIFEENWNLIRKQINKDPKMIGRISK